MTHATDASAKAVMRLQMRAIRQAFVRAHPEADWLAGDHVGDMVQGLFGRRAQNGVIALYRASGSEIDPRPLGEKAMTLGWSLALPASEALDSPVVFRRWTPGERLAPDIAGIPAPLVSAEEVRPDVILTPLLAFDRQGGRLGQGAGYYDRTMDALRATARPPAFVGLAFSCQEVARVPTEPHDERLEAILTEKEFIRVRKEF